MLVGIGQAIGPFTASSVRSTLPDNIRWSDGPTPRPADVPWNELRLAGVQALRCEQRMSLAWTQGNHLW
ncbi:hypothetical protein THIX_30761 [Thiomonas sp. X19]|nr:hypothetical protein THIX_30761 [Thiomonas sp. X19]